MRTPRSSGHACWLPLLLALLLVIGGCGGDDGGTPADATVRQSIGAAGGSLSSADGAFTLTIPAGALGNETEIVIAELSAANQPAAVQALGADKVYRLDPSGLQFVQPVAYTVMLPPSPSGQIAVALTHSAGAWEWVAAQSMTVSAVGRSMSGQLSHFSELALKEAGVSYRTDVQPREIEPGQALTSSLRISKAESRVRIEIERSGRFDDAPLIEVPETETGNMRFVSVDENGSLTLPPIGASYALAYIHECVLPHSGSITFRFKAVFPDASFVGILFALQDKKSIDVGWGDGYECKGTAPPPPRPPPEQSILTGLRPMPLGMRAVDGIVVTLKAFAAARAYVALIAGHFGALGIDLSTGDVVLNQTAGAPEGQLGNAALLGVLPVSAPDPGASTPAALFGTSAIGGAVRGYNLPPPAQGSLFRWGPTLLTQTQVLDAATPGADLVADEVMTTVPGTGLNFYRRDADRWLQTIEQVRAFNFDGALRSAVLPEGGLGKPLLALTAGSDNGSTSSVWYHPRQPNSPAIKLFSMIPGANAARRLRCQTWDAVSAQIGRVLCAATEPGGTASVFRFDPANPTATPVVTTLAVGAGATGVQFGKRANGNPWAAVANYDANTLNIIDWDAAGNLLGNRSEPVPEGCLNPAHAAPFTAGGQDYIAGTCNGSDHYFVVRYEYRF